MDNSESRETLQYDRGAPVFQDKEVMCRRNPIQVEKPNVVTLMSVIKFCNLHLNLHFLARDQIPR